MKKWIVPLSFGFALAVGYLVAVESWNGEVYVYLGEQRAPASTRSIRDYSALDRKALYRSVHKQMLSEAKLVKKDGYLGVKLGHPVLRKGRGAAEFACAVPGREGLFDRVELSFVGMGVTESGSQPRMIVETLCAPGQSLNSLRTIWIPMQDIVRSSPRDQELQLYGDHPVTVRMIEIPGQWPESWVLWNVRLFREANPDEALALDPKQMREARAKLLSFEWKP